AQPDRADPRRGVPRAHPRRQGTGVSGIAPLLGAELRRFFSRRLMRLAFAFGIALATVVLVIQTVRSEISTVSQRHQSFECFRVADSSGPGEPPSIATVPQDCVPQGV